MMRNRLTVKLFLVLLMTAGVVVVAMLLLMRWSFQRGFTDYLNELDEAQMVPVIDRLEEYYATAGSWGQIRRQERLWLELTLGDTAHEPMMPPEPPRGMPGRRGERFPPPPGHGHADNIVGPRLTLFDRERKRVFGRAAGPEGQILKPLRLRGETVGWLGLQPLPAPSAERDVRFMQQQATNLYLIAAVTVLVAVLASLLLARRLLVPIRALAEGARRLARGEYAARVPVTSRDELGRLADDFNHLGETLAANETARRRWIADISHELRTPLSILLGEIEALRDGVRACSDQATQSLHSETRHLSKLVDDLYQLALSDLGALTYHKEEVDLGALVAAMVAACQERYTAAGLSLRFEQKDGDVEVFADRQRMTQLVQNLLENSLRYTDAGGRVVVRCGQAGDKAVLDIHDSAPGVSPEALHRLFERLFREEASRNRARGGAGLGLAIARNIVEAHHGSITAQPSPLGGLWMRIELPLTNGEYA